MLRIPCPYCGLRDQVEFSFGGEADRVRPEEPSKLDSEAWSEYLFYRENTKGEHRELWVHSYGCRQWFELIRNTADHEIISSHRLGESTRDDSTQDEPA